MPPTTPTKSGSRSDTDEHQPNERVILTPSEQSQSQAAGTSGSRFGLGRLTAALSGHQDAVGDQTVETRKTDPTTSIFSRGVPTVEAADGVDEYYGVYRSTAIVNASINNFAADVWEPGFRVETDNDDATEWLEQEWLPQAAVLHGGTHQDFLPFGKQTTIQRWTRGGALIEHVRTDPTDKNSLITGLHFIPPETVSFVRYENRPILVDPDPSEHLIDAIPDDLPKTQRDEYPAYIQYHEDAARKSDQDEIPLSQNDVTRTIFNGDAAGAGSDTEQFWGTPVTEVIAEDVAGFKNIIRDKEVAIKNKAYGLWRMAFSPQSIEFTEVKNDGTEVEVTELLEWDEESMKEVRRQVEKEMGPGSILTHDGKIELDRLDSEVPDLIADLEFYISNITAALPTPLFVVGFEDNINQFVTEHQNARYQRLIQWEREELERTFSGVLKRVLESDDAPHEADEVEFKIEPLEETSPILSLTDEEVERMNTWAEAFNRVRGDLPVDMFVDPEVLRSEILMLPEEAEPDLEERGINEDDAINDLIDEIDRITGDGEDADGDVPPEFEEQQDSPPPGAEADD